MILCLIKKTINNIQEHYDNIHDNIRNHFMVHTYILPFG